MRLAFPRFTIRTMMIAVAVCALVLILGISVPSAIDPLMGDRGLSVGTAAYLALVTVFVALLALPFVGALALIIGGSPGEALFRRVTIRRWVLAIGLIALEWALLTYPLDSLRWAYRLRDGSFVTFYHQHRFMPGAYATPCLEVISGDGRAKTYPIAKNIYLGLPVDFRTNADQSVVWLVADDPRINEKRVLCSLNRLSGEFTATEGHHHPDVSESGGLPLWHKIP